MVLGNMDVGLSTQNLTAILLVVALSVINIFGIKTGAIIQNIFTAAKVSALFGLVLLGIFLGRNAQALAANFQGNFWRNAGLGADARHRWRRAGQHADRIGRCPGGIAVFGRRLEQCDLHRRRSEEPQPQSAAFAGPGHGRGDRALHRLQFHLPQRVAAGWNSQWRDHPGTRHQVRYRRARRHRGHDADVRKRWAAC